MSPLYSHSTSAVLFFELHNPGGMCRLNKDIEDIEKRVQQRDFSLEKASQYNVVQITFASPAVGSSGPAPADQTSVPCHFSVEIPKYYPHDRPLVRCLNPCKPSPFIREHGIVCHPSLADGWVATNSLYTVVEILQLVRASCHLGNPAVGFQEDSTMVIDQY